MAGIGGLHGNQYLSEATQLKTVLQWSGGNGSKENGLIAVREAPDMITGSSSLNQLNHHMTGPRPKKELNCGHKKREKFS